MKEMFYSHSTLEAQRQLLRRKRLQLVLSSIIYVLVTVSVCLLQSRQTQALCTIVNAVISSVYFSYLLYFFSYAYKKERKYEDHIDQVLKGKSNSVAGVLQSFCTDCSGLEEVRILQLIPEGTCTEIRTYEMNCRVGFDPSCLAGSQVILHLYMNHVVGIEAVP